jgi:hypothetical protein
VKTPPTLGIIVPAKAEVEGKQTEIAIFSALLIEEDDNYDR